MRKKTRLETQQLSNLYQFIRLVLGEDITDGVIAEKWKMDIKNFSDFKYGKYPVPRFERLVSLARLLEVDDHLVYEVAKGMPAEQIYHLLEKLRRRGVRKITSRNIARVYDAVTETGKYYRELFIQAGDPIMAMDARTGKIIDCNGQAEELLGRPRSEIVGMNYLKIYPAAKRPYFRRQFKRLIKSRTKIMRFQFELLRKGGQIVPVDATGNLLQIDGRPMVQGIFRKINDAKTITVNYIVEGSQKPRRAAQAAGG